MHKVQQLTIRTTPMWALTTRWLGTGDYDSDWGHILTASHWIQSSIWNKFLIAIILTLENGGLPTEKTKFPPSHLIPPSQRRIFWTLQSNISEKLKNIGQLCLSLGHKRLSKCFEQQISWHCLFKRRDSLAYIVLQTGGLSGVHVVYVELLCWVFMGINWWTVVFHVVLYCVLYSVQCSGKYVQTESENYDEFLKALGVGMLLRKVHKKTF